MFRKLREKLARARLRAFLVRHQTKDRVLDIGSSTKAYGELFPNSVGVDIDESKRPDIIGDAHNLPCGDNEFDVVLCTEVLEHLHSPHIAISEMRRVLKVGGMLILTTRFIYPIHDGPHDYFRFTKYGLRYLFRDWEIVELTPETSTMETFSVLLQTLAYKTTLAGGKLTKALFLFAALMTSKVSWMLTEERGSGRHGPKRVEDHLMSSGYYLVCKNTK